MSRSLALILVMTVILFGQSTLAQHQAHEADLDTQNYSFGFRFGRGLLTYGIEFRPEIFWHGLFAPIDKVKPLYGQDQMKGVLQQLDSHRSFPVLSDQLEQERLEIQNYSLGYRLGSELTRHGVALKPQILLDGVFDAYLKRKPQHSLDEMAGTLRSLETRMRKPMLLPEVQHFLAANAAAGDVTVTKSGLQYRVIKNGDGETPRKSDTVLVHYRTSSIHGIEFDSSYPLDIPSPKIYKIEEVIPGWAEALLMMKEGSKWRLYIPSYLAYGDSGPMAGQTVVVELELLKIIPSVR